MLAWGLWELWVGSWESWGVVEFGGYLEVQQPREQGLPGMGCIIQQVLPLDDIDDLSQQQVLGRVSQPDVKYPVWLEQSMGCWKGLPMGTAFRGPFPPDTPCGPPPPPPSKREMNSECLLRAGEDYAYNLIEFSP